MKYHELNVAGHRRPKRIGRGIAAGQGKTAGRGTKGQKSRAGSTKRPGFAGGQNPLMQQLPKLPGFTSYRQPAAVVFTDQLGALKTSNVDAIALAQAGLIAHPYLNVKLLCRGGIKSKLQVKLPGASAKAVAAIESAGGSFIRVERLARAAKSKAKAEPQ